MLDQRVLGQQPMATTGVIVGGTEGFVRVSGQLRAQGRFTAAGGEGRYSGEVCKP